MTDEEALTGGFVNTSIVRIGDTVRRPRQDSSPFVADLLLHLEQVGFDGVPRYLGSDEQGREIFSFIPGEVPDSVRHFSDGQIAAAAKLLRGFHDATRGTSLAGEREVVCHNDLNVRNIVLQDDIPVAWLDFDMAAPGEALTDVAYLAWGFCISSYWPPAKEAPAQAHQVRILADSYGVDDEQRTGLIDGVLTHQQRLITLADDRIALLEGNTESSSTPVQNIPFWEGVREWATLDHAFTQENADVFRRALRS